MAKGDDSVRRKKNKVLRKKLQKGPSSVSARVASIIASKKRRKSGKRRICEFGGNNRRNPTHLVG